LVAGVIRAIDLFAGAGGFSEGATAAGCVVVWAANHWRAAVDVHATNHPDTAHACQDLQQADWTRVPEHDLLLASPACQGPSPARGKERPHHDACRSTAWAVVAALECHRPPLAMVENVPAFTKWALFPAWCSALTALGYAIAPHVVDCADLGVPQNRERVFIAMTRSRHPVELRLDTCLHVPASNIIDFNAGRWSPIERKGRAANTLARIANGRRQHGERFLTAFYGATKTGRGLDRPIGTITTRDRWAVIDGDRMRMLSVPEARRAMTFRGSYVLPPNNRDAMMMLGNAVPPLAAQRVIEALRAAA
jgi:DNA (cytosine-5)-methyltransferase 1